MNALRATAAHLIKTHAIEDSFYIASLQTLKSNIQTWFNHLPRITPHYAVKCNPDQTVLNTLFKDGRIGFDCASIREMDLVARLGMNPSKHIVFAHPCKKPSDINHARTLGVKLTVFDNVNELHKLKQHFPHCEAMLRIRIDNPDARVQLGLKYGAEDNECKDLLKRANDLGIHVKGVSFHVGSASKDPNVFRRAIDKSLNIMSKQPPMTLLDIGGGFQKHNFVQTSEVINRALEDVPGDIKIIAEPGRYFVEDVFTFFTPIIGIRQRQRQTKEYFIADGLYGSLNCVIYDKHTPNYDTLYSPLLQATTKSTHTEISRSTLWGSTCDSADMVMNDAMLPSNLRVGDFLVFKNFGAYTLAGACDFNGINFTKPSIFYI